MKKPELSIVILNYNTKALLTNCLDSLKKISKEANFEVIVVDNGSTDNSVGVIRKSFPWVKVIENGSNLGFAKGNNAARHVVKGSIVLFLNSDTLALPGCLSDTLVYLSKNKNVGAVTCKIVLPSGKLDKDARRSFPTPWVALSHFSGLEKLFPKSKLFAKYWYGYVSVDEIQEVDVLQGAFCMVRKQILDEVGWYSEDYFLDGEDIDLCWKIKEKGWKIVYYPKVSIVHLKKGTKKNFKSISVGTGVDSMGIFYKKYLWKKYPLALNYLVLFGILLMKSIRGARKII